MTFCEAAKLMLDGVTVRRACWPEQCFLYLNEDQKEFIDETGYEWQLSPGGAYADDWEILSYCRLCKKIKD